MLELLNVGMQIDDTEDYIGLRGSFSNTEVSCM
jgi:hypothetical protein